MCTTKFVGRRFVINDIDGYICSPDPRVAVDQVKQWYPMDSQERFHKVKEEFESEFGTPFPWTEDCVSYNLDRYGFRGNNLPSSAVENSLMALGCSQTFGIGIKEEQTWPTLLGKHLDIPAYNLGAPGMGYETMFRLLHHWWPKIRSKNVFMFVNPSCRREFFNENCDWPAWSTVSASPHHMENFEDRVLMMFLNEKNCTASKQRAVYAIKGFCDVNDINLFGVDIYPCPIEDVTKYPAFMEHTKWFRMDVARDNAHHGPIFNEKLADYFRSEYVSNLPS
jgi:hypothetical protein